MIREEFRYKWQYTMCNILEVKFLSLGTGMGLKAPACNFLTMVLVSQFQFRGEVCLMMHILIDGISTSKVL